MINLLDKIKFKLVAGVLATSIANSPAWAVSDVLETPAAKTDIATEHLLLDVAKAGSRLVAVGERGHILVSDDNGDSWKQVDVPVSVLLTAVHFVDSQHGWAVGHGGAVLASKDGGETWVKQFDGNEANQSIIRQAEELVEEYEALLANASEDELGDLEYELEEAQFGLEDAQFDAEVGASKPFLDVYFVDRNVGFAVGAYGFMFKTSDGGGAWENYGGRTDNIDKFHLNTIAQIPGGTLLAAGEAGLMMRSEDLGESWEMVDSPYDGSFFGLSATGEEDVALAFGLRGNLFRSEDGGVSWEEIDSDTESTLMGASFDGSGKVTIVGNSGAVLLSSDNGQSFSESIRENRLGNVALVYVDASRLVVVGESGVNVTNPSGKNL